ncbi:metal ABC transporter substrate-binding protein [Tepidibacillus fermentans]|uniref:Zinc transport system substrate-binding protein n=1 Tax=Tepidibacillus fermentans TaxID=1281767 RepID=A0A4V2USX0_9BACI|nr:metal ABC transporter substrate-binding protein [Tepidibacillus fermentans]TCS83101.1 zinc transport system substrate-binding protein [Tepidibacillus fermentans]
MKKSGILLSILILTLIVFAGCATNNGTQKGKDADKVQVYTSFYVLADFAKKIGGDYVEVTNMIPAGTEPHDFEPTPKQIAQLQKADLFVYNGTGFDQWAKKIVENNQGKMTVVNSTEGIRLLTLNEEEKNHKNGGGADPHVWLNPMNAMIQAEKIKDGLIKVDPSHKDTYTKNYEQLRESFIQLDKTYQYKLKDAKAREIFVSHAAFGYLADRYQLKQVAIAGLTPSDEPSPKELAEIVNEGKKMNIKYILFEPLVESKYATTIMNEIGAKPLTLNPIETLTKEEIEKGEDYFSMMNKNLEVLQIALGVK